MRIHSIVREQRDVDELINNLDNNDCDTKERVLLMLGQQGEEAEKAIPKIIQALRDECRHVPAAAGWALTRTGFKTVPFLINSIKDEHFNVRYYTTLALGSYGEKAKEVVPALITALEDRDWRVHVIAAESLGKIRKKAIDAVPYLKNHLEKESSMKIKYILAVAITQIEQKKGDGTRFLDDMKEKGYFEDWQEEKYESLYQELDLKKDIAKLDTKIDNIRDLSKKQTDGYKKEELLKEITELKKQMIQLEKKIDQLIYTKENIDLKDGKKLFDFKI